MTWSDRLDDHVDEAGRGYLDRLQETGDHIAELTEIARDFVESLEGDSEIDLEPVNLGSVLEAEIEKTRATHGEDTVVVGDIPRVAVRANELLSSVFGNLLSNAIRHNDSAQPEVRVTVRETDTHVRVRVADNGPGVPDEHKEDIFGKGTMAPDSPGTGIGLFLVSTLVDQYNGRIWVEDRERTDSEGSDTATGDGSSGSVFIVELPKTDQEPQDGTAPGWG